MAAVAGDVPQVNALGIEFPGYVRNLDATLALFGGPSGLAKAFTTGNRILPLHFRPGDPISHPVFGERQSARGLIVKLVKASKEGPDSNKGQVVAKVNSIYRFPGTADFQYVADITLPIQQEGPQADKLEDVYGTAVEPLLALPPLFTRLDIPVDYHYRSFYGEDPPAFRGPGGVKSKGQLPPYVMKAISLGVPPKVHLPEIIEGSFKPEKRELLKRIHAILEERPIWCAPALHEQLQDPRPSLSELEALLPRLAYTFRSGEAAIPGRTVGVASYRQWCTLCRRSAEKLDARARHTCRLDLLRSKVEMDDDEDDGSGKDAPVLPPVATSYTQITRFAALPKQQSTMLQMCDIEDRQVAAIVSSSVDRATYDPVSGWWTTLEVDRISRRVKARFQAMLDKAAPADLRTSAADQDDDGMQMNDSAPAEVDAARAASQPAAQEPVQAESQLAGLRFGGSQDPSSAKNNIVPDGVLESLLATWAQPGSQQDGRPADGGPPGGDEEDAAAVAAAVRAGAEEFEIFEDESEEAEGSDMEDDAIDDDDDDEEEDDGEDAAD